MPRRSFEQRYECSAPSPSLLPFSVFPITGERRTPRAANASGPPLNGRMHPHSTHPLDEAVTWLEHLERRRRARGTTAEAIRGRVQLIVTSADRGGGRRRCRDRGGLRLRRGHARIRELRTRRIRADPTGCRRAGRRPYRPVGPRHDRHGYGRGAAGRPLPPERTDATHAERQRPYLPVPGMPHAGAPLRSRSQRGRREGRLHLDGQPGVSLPRTSHAQTSQRLEREPARRWNPALDQPDRQTIRRPPARREESPKTAERERIRRLSCREDRRRIHS